MNASIQTDSSSLAQQAGFLLQLAHQGARRVFNEALGPLNIQAKHLGVLMALGGKEALSQIQISRRLELDKSSVVLIVDDLERLGFAQRKANPNDRRAHVLEITTSGQQVVSKARQIAIAADEAIFAGLSARDRINLDRALSTVIRNCAAYSGRK
jgi:DNA-binding MarR family transcriptional regulator